MTTDLESPRVKGFVPSVLPWILAAVMLAVFGATMARGINLYNLGEVVSLGDWRQSPDTFGPLTLIVTLPLRWLPANLMPLGLHALSALFAALTLALLARSVALLPHDRTHEQREREDSELSILTIPTAWLPPLFAVVVCGLQMTFWEHATLDTGEIFNLFLFAYIIRCLLEFRVSGRESWLIRFALVYGLAMANNWAMIFFLPLSLGALVWFKGLSALNPRFLLRTFGLLLAGALLIFMLPLLNQILHPTQQGFWPVLRSTISYDKLVFSRYPRDVVAILALTSILPVFVMGIRWSSYFGDNSPLGIFLATSMFHIVHGLFLLVGLWVMLDSPISPRVMGYGLAFLPLYYLTALSVGYLSGYFLLVFGKRKHRESMHPLVRMMKLGVVACVWLLALGMPVVLVLKNLPHLRALNALTSAYEKHFQDVAKLLPSQGAVVLSDDGVWLSYLKATINQESGNNPSHLYVDTVRLENEPAYLGELQKSNPSYQICGPWTNTPPNAAPGLAKVQLLQHLAQSHGLYYINPSFGYYFEAFYPEPHGVVYQLKPYPKGAWDAPPLSKGLIAENQAFWQKISTGDLAMLADYINKESPTPPGLLKTVMTRLHLKREPESLAGPISAYYARELNEWGADLQLAGMRKEADIWFDRVIELNPGTLVARVNKAFDEGIAQHKQISIHPSKDVDKALEQVPGGCVELLHSDGPVDEPSFRCQLGQAFVNSLYYRQAIQQFSRARQLVPGDLRVPLQIAQIFVELQTYSNGLAMQLPYTEGYQKALTNLDLVLNSYPNQPNALLMKSFVLMEMQSYDKAIAPLSRALEQPIDTNSLIAAQLYRGIAYYKTGNYNAAKIDYQAVSHSVPKSYQAYYGLAEIAYHQKDKPSAIRNYELYLTNAPSDTEEARSVNARLKELKSGAP